MRKLIAAMSLALLLAGCGEEAKKKAVVVDKWAEWEANPEPYGGLEVLAKIKKAKESGATKLNLSGNEISDLSPLEGLTKLKELYLHNNYLDRNKITDLSPLAGLTNLKRLNVGYNKISDVSPLKGLANLKGLALHKNQIKDLSPLAGLTNLKELYLAENPISEDQKTILKKALSNCKIFFEDASD